MQNPSQTPNREELSKLAELIKAGRDSANAAVDTAKAVKELIRVTEKTSVASLLRGLAMSPLMALTGAVQKRSRNIADQIVGNAGKDSGLGRFAGEIFQGADRGIEEFQKKVAAIIPNLLGLEKNPFEGLGELLEQEIGTFPDRFGDALADSIVASISKGKLEVVLPKPTAVATDKIREIQEINPFPLIKKGANTPRDLSTPEKMRFGRILANYQRLGTGLLDRANTIDAERASGLTAGIKFQAGRQNLVNLHGIRNDQDSQIGTQLVNRLYYGGQANVVAPHSKTLTTTSLFDGVEKSSIAFANKVTEASAIFGAGVQEAVSGLVRLTQYPAYVAEELGYQNSLNYGVAEIAGDIARAINEDGVKPEDILLVGHSAGANRAAAVIEILQKMGITGVKAVANAGSGFGRNPNKNVLQTEANNDLVVGSITTALGTGNFDNPAMIPHQDYLAYSNRQYQERIGNFLGRPAAVSFNSQSYNPAPETRQRQVLIDDLRIRNNLRSEDKFRATIENVPKDTDLADSQSNLGILAEGLRKLAAGDSKTSGTEFLGQMSVVFDKLESAVNSGVSGVERIAQVDLPGELKDSDIIPNIQKIINDKLNAYYDYILSEDFVVDSNAGAVKDIELPDLAGIADQYAAVVESAKTELSLLEALKNTLDVHSATGLTFDLDVPQMIAEVQESISAAFADFAEFKPTNVTIPANAEKTLSEVRRGQLQINAYLKQLEKLNLASRGQVDIGVLRQGVQDTVIQQQPDVLAGGDFSLPDLSQQIEEMEQLSQQVEKNFVSLGEYIRALQGMGLSSADAVSALAGMGEIGAIIDGVLESSKGIMHGILDGSVNIQDALTRYAQDTAELYEMAGQLAERGDLPAMLSMVFSTVNNARAVVEPDFNKIKSINQTVSKAGAIASQSAKNAGNLVTGKPIEAIQTDPIATANRGQLQKALRTLENRSAAEFRQEYGNKPSMDLLRNKVRGFGDAGVAALDFDSEKRILAQTKNNLRSIRDRMETALKKGNVELANNLGFQHEKLLQANKGRFSNGNEFQAQQQQIKRIQNANASLPLGVEQPQLDAAKVSEVDKNVAKFRAASDKGNSPSNELPQDLKDLIARIKPIVDSIVESKTFNAGDFYELRNAAGAPKAQLSYEDLPKGVAGESYENEVVLSRELRSKLAQGSRKALGVLVHELVHAAQFAKPGSLLMTNPSQYEEFAYRSLALAKNTEGISDAEILASERSAYEAEFAIREDSTPPKLAPEATEAATVMPNFIQAIERATLALESLSRVALQRSGARLASVGDKGTGSTEDKVKAAANKVEGDVANKLGELGEFFDNPVFSSSLRGVRQLSGLVGKTTGNPGGALANGLSGALTARAIPLLFNAQVNRLIQVRELNTNDQRIQQLTGGRESISSARQAANRLNVSTNNFAESFQKIQATLRGTSQEQLVGRYAGTVSRLMQYSGLDRGQQGALQMGYIQALSKNPDRVYAEELRGQISEALPGIMAKLAQQRGESIGDLQTSVQQGKVSGADLMRASESLATELSQNRRSSVEYLEMLGQRAREDSVASGSGLDAALGKAAKRLLDFYTELDSVRSAVSSVVGALLPAAIISTIISFGKLLFATEGLIVGMLRAAGAMGAGSLFSNFAAGMLKSIGVFAALTLGVVALNQVIESVLADKERNEKPAEIAQAIKDLAAPKTGLDAPRPRAEGNIEQATDNYNDFLRGIIPGWRERDAAFNSNALQYRNRRQAEAAGINFESLSTATQQRLNERESIDRESSVISRNNKALLSNVNPTVVAAEKAKEADLQQQAVVLKAQIIAARAQGQKTDVLTAKLTAVQTELISSQERRAEQSRPLEQGKSKIDKEIAYYEKRIADNPGLEPELRPFIDKLKKEGKLLADAIAEINAKVTPVAQKMIHAFSEQALRGQRNDRLVRVNDNRAEANQQVALLRNGNAGSAQVQAANQQTNLRALRYKQSLAVKELQELERVLNGNITEALKATVEQLSGVKLELLSPEDLARVKARIQQSGSTEEIQGLDELEVLINRRADLKLNTESLTGQINRGKAELENILYQQAESLYQYQKGLVRELEDSRQQITRATRDLGNSSRQLDLSSQQMRINAALETAKTQISNSFAGIAGDFTSNIGSILADWFSSVTESATLAVDKALIQAQTQQQLQQLADTRTDLIRGEQRRIQDRQDAQRQQFGGAVPTAPRVTPVAPQSQSQSSTPRLPGVQTMTRSAQQYAPQAFDDRNLEGRARIAILQAIVGTEVTDWASSRRSAQQMSQMRGENPNMLGPYQFNLKYHRQRASTLQGQQQFLGDILSGRARTPDSKSQKDYGKELAALIQQGKINSGSELRQYLSRSLGYEGGRNWQGLTDGWNRAGGLENRLFSYLKNSAIPTSQISAAPANQPTNRIAATPNNRGFVPQSATAPANMGDYDRATAQNRGAILRNNDAQLYQRDQQQMRAVSNEAALRAKMRSFAEQERMRATIEQRRTSAGQQINQLNPNGSGVLQGSIDRINSETELRNKQDELANEVRQAAIGYERALEVFRRLPGDGRAREMMNSTAAAYSAALDKYNAQLGQANNQAETDRIRRDKEARDRAIESVRSTQDLEAQATESEYRISTADPNIGIMQRARQQGESDARGLQSSNASARRTAEDLKRKLEDLLDATGTAVGEGGVLQPPTNPRGLPEQELAAAMAELSETVKQLTANNRILAATGEEAQATLRGIAEAAGARELANFVRGQRLSVLDRADSAITGNPFGSAGRNNPARAAIARERSRINLEQTLADIDANAANYASYPGGVEALKNQMRELAAIDLSNTIKGMDSVRLGLRDVFRSSLQGLRTDLANPDISFTEALQNFGQRLIDGVADTLFNNFADQAANKLAERLPGGDLTAKSFGGGRPGDPGTAGLNGQTSGKKGRDQLAGAEQLLANPLGVPVVVQNPAPVAPASTTIPGATQIPVPPPIAGGGSGGKGFGGAAMMGLGVGLTVLQSSKSKKEARRRREEERNQDSRRFWQTDAQWQPGGMGTGMQPYNWVTGGFDRAISSSQTLSESLNGLRSAVGSATTPVMAFGAELSNSGLTGPTGNNSYYQPTTNVRVVANDLRSFRGSQSQIAATTNANNSLQSSRLG
jgi:tape measure domain-containing protein